MADWTYTPKYSYVLGIEPPLTKINKFGDGSAYVRELSTTCPRTFVEEHYVDKTTMGAMLTFFRSKRASVPFTKKTYDPSEADNTECNVRFKSMKYSPSQEALNYWMVVFEFEEDL